MLDFGFYNMDCMDGMREFPDKYFDLAICDPPYGIGADEGTGKYGRLKIARYGKDGDIILDTHVGSASSLIACHNTGHKFVGFELDPDYYAAAKARLESVQAQTSLFDMVI